MAHTEMMRTVVETELAEFGDMRFAFAVDGECVRESLRDLCTRAENSSAAREPPDPQWFASFYLIAAARAVATSAAGYPTDLQPAIDWLRGAVEAEQELVKAEQA